MHDDEPSPDDLQAAERFSNWWSELADDLATAAANEEDLVIGWKRARRFVLELIRSAPFDPQTPYERALLKLRSSAEQAYGEAKLGYLITEEGLLGPLR